MNNQLELLFPGDRVIHVGSRQSFVVAGDQSPVRSLEWIHGPETVYCVTSSTGQRIPLDRRTIARPENQVTR